MRKYAIYALGMLFAFFTGSCNESLEDTYDEFTKGGMIRYVGRCSNVQVKAGWERLQVIWKNHADAGIERVKVTWQSENETTPEVRYIERAELNHEGDLMDTIYLEGLGNSMYTVRVCNVVADDSESLIEEKYGRPYTFAHEDLGTFTRGISFFSRLGDKLAIVLDRDNENIRELELCYHVEGKDEVCRWNIKEHMDDTLSYVRGGWELIEEPDNMFLLPVGAGEKIDFTKPLFIERRGLLSGCVDTIKFEPMNLNFEERLWSTEFAQLMLKLYGNGWEEKMNEVEIVELDYDFTSFLDLLYLPNLKKVILGKNRYMQPSFVRSFTSTTDKYVACVTLAFLQAMRPGFSVEHYNNHYFVSADYEAYNSVDKFKELGKIMVNELGTTNLNAKPTYESCDTTGWKVTCSDTLCNGYADNGAAWLLYDAKLHFEDDWDEWDEEVYFEPRWTLGASIVTVTYDMGRDKSQIVRGFKVKQPERNQKDDSKYLLSSLMIEFSNDGYSWTKATYTDGSAIIGNSPAEETYIVVPEDLCREPVRYIRLTMSTHKVDDQGAYNLRLGKFIPLSKLNF
ncbi:DUF4998 domain-containing protein [Butyricimonas hominis]|uniref:F5/8 type C domain-containing protein n=1 Tax=Butyricimonas hominis TaxID=2763032 RepID=A0ABR7D0N6_9BACT|nr:DUF4998 domain-containing protein [Butyricimonas hominis]MBC5621491.1 hypothetical protein [Butyricimonas hominis]